MTDSNYPYQNAQTNAIQKVEQVVDDTTNDAAQKPLDAFINHQKKALEEGSKAIESLLPEGFREHGKEAGKEFARGFKVLVDAAVGELEKASRELDKQFRQRSQNKPSPSQDDDKPSTTGATKVKVQVE